MEIKMNKITLIIGILTILSSCSVNPKDDKASKMNKKQSSVVMISEENIGETIRINLQQKLILSLKSNPSTGYKWYLLEQENSPLELVEPSIYKADKTDAKLIGSGGVDIFTFSGVSSGKTKLNLNYSRSTIKNSSDKTFSVDIIIGN